MKRKNQNLITTCFRIATNDKLKLNSLCQNLNITKSEFLRIYTLQIINNESFNFNTINTKTNQT